MSFGVAVKDALAFVEDGKFVDIGNVYIPVGTFSQGKPYHLASCSYNVQSAVYLNDLLPKSFYMTDLVF